MVSYASILDSGNGNHLSVEGEGDFNIKDGIVSNNGELIETTSDDMAIVDITGITKIRKGAFVEQSDSEDPDAESRFSDVTTLVLGDGQDIEFEEGCFEGSAVKHIVCASIEQKTAIERKLSAIGIGLNEIHVAVKEAATNGSVYFSCPESDDGYSALLSAPADITSFDGTLTAQDGSEVDITAIGPRAFKDCASLKWLPLNESVDFIGSGAFSGCTALEGLFIGNKNSITVESGIFSNCDNMAFFASRAMQANFAGNETPSYYTVMYCPTGSTGYTGGFQYFLKEANATDYAMTPQDNGTYLLYGCSTYAGDTSPTP